MFIKTAPVLLVALAIMTSTAAFAQRAYYRTWGENVAPRVFDEPKSHSAGHQPRAFYDQEQPGYPQSPPEGGR
jgi:hypothetical protein